MSKNFVVFNFHGFEQPQKFLTCYCFCVKKWKLTSEPAVFKAITFTGTFWSAAVGEILSCHNR